MKKKDFFVHWSRCRSLVSEKSANKNGSASRQALINSSNLPREKVENATQRLAMSADFAAQCALT